MATIVVVDSEAGSLDRYEYSAPNYRRTHGCTWGKPRTLTPAIVEEFRLTPLDEFAVEPPPTETPPPSGSGECDLPCDVEALAA